MTSLDSAPLNAPHRPGKPAKALVPVRRIVIGQWGRVFAEVLRNHCRDAFPEATITIGGTGGEILAALYAQRADLLVLSMSLPDTHGADILAQINRSRLARRVLITLHYRDECSLVALRDAQFDGLIDMQDEGLDTFVKALRGVGTGQPYVSRIFRGSVIDRRKVGMVWEQLTRAELRVLAAIGDGSKNEEVAQDLGLRETTVQAHRRNLMHKLGIRSSAKLVREAIRLGIVRILSDGMVIRAGLDHPVGRYN